MGSSFHIFASKPFGRKNTVYTLRRGKPDGMLQGSTVYIFRIENALMPLPMSLSPCDLANGESLLTSDEITVPYATCACGRTAWVLLLCVGLGLSTKLFFTTNCVGTLVALFSYESASILVGIMSLVVEFQIAKASMSGTIIGECFLRSIVLLTR